MRPLVLLALLVGCTDVDEPVVEQPPILEVGETASWRLPALDAEAQVLRTAGDVPHIYAHDEPDAVRVLAFLYARDRLFTLDLARRLSLGRVSELLGSLGLPTDVDSRLIGMTHVADQIVARSSAEELALMEAYAEGVNAAIDAVNAGELPLPSELVIAGPLLGTDDPRTLLVPFEVRDVAGVMATLIYQLAFNREDLDHSLARAALADTLPLDAPDRDRRLEAAITDAADDVAPLYDLVTAVGWDPGSAPRSVARPPQRPSPALTDQLRDLTRRLDRLSPILGSGGDTRGSNAWAVMGSHTADGRALLAGDGHLSLSVPSLFWQVGVDTTVLGDGQLHQLGLGLPGAPFMVVGTNGDVAWSQTRLRFDLTDWYREELRLEGGLPTATRFDGAWREVGTLDERVSVGAALGGAPGSEDFTRYTTFDGRLLVSVEGTTLEDRPTGPAVRLADGWVVPEDLDGNGIIEGISLDYVGLDPTGILVALRRFGQADTVEDILDASRYLGSYGQNIIAADSTGSVASLTASGVPCREALDRAEGWAPGHDPGQLLDGTVVPGFTVPVTDDLAVDDRSDAEGCAVPHDAHPFAVDPEQGWLMTANQDPGGHSLDGDLSNDAWYLGGPWDAGFRANRLAEGLTSLVEAREADVDAMASLQADHQAGDARILLPSMLQALDAAARADADALDPVEARLGALWEADPRLPAATARLRAWAEGGFEAASGVQTAWHIPTDEERADAVATMIFYAWHGVWSGYVFDDEGLPDGLWRPSRSSGVVRAEVRILEGRGADNPGGLASWSPTTEESVWFDDLGTPDTVESSDEGLVLTLSRALDTLTAAPDDDGFGGFGTDDPDAWLWGLRHMVRFESLLADFLGDDPLLGSVTRQFAITPEVLPVDPTAEVNPRVAPLPWFPRPGGNGTVDAASHGFGTRDFTYATGPAFRMVFALGPDRVDGVNILPGGQSALTDSPHFADQALLWLGNEAYPMHFAVEDVITHAVGRESFRP